MAVSCENSNILRVPETFGNSSVSELLAASQEEVSSMESLC
jgi:hypothetical protein